MQDKHDIDVTARQFYSAPQLSEFGRVRDLTAGGSGGVPEAGSQSKQKHA